MPSEIDLILNMFLYKKSLFVSDPFLPLASPPSGDIILQGEKRDFDELTHIEPTTEVRMLPWGGFITYIFFPRTYAEK